MDHALPASSAPSHLGLASEALVAMARALDCLDAIGAHQYGAHLDYTIHLLRQWCVAQRGVELYGAVSDPGN
ncbi:hypothetical protein [Sphingomonas cavernae]|uniref:Uncharacterized protein n=1 Tax=Sphingomonas cavernae TaxID=2320861 RepID=A0A418WQE0_9SPHN|nr:hypothetical protein [Sphingomonas cavernae]RJF93462.1 hypothetical protein D3876_03805 [Sphingomonas cavernae]